MMACGIAGSSGLPALSFGTLMGSHQVAGELVEALGIAGVDGGPVMNAETRIPPGQEKVDPIPGDEVSVSKKSEDLVPEEELCLVGVDEGDG